MQSSLFTDSSRGLCAVLKECAEVAREIVSMCSEIEGDPLLASTMMSSISQPSTQQKREEDDVLQNLSAHCEVFVACATGIVEQQQHGLGSPSFAATASHPLVGSTSATTDNDGSFVVAAASPFSPTTQKSLITKLFVDGVKIVVCASCLDERFPDVQRCASQLAILLLGKDGDNGMAFGRTFWTREINVTSTGHSTSFPHHPVPSSHPPATSSSTSTSPTHKPIGVPPPKPPATKPAGAVVMDALHRLFSTSLLTLEKEQQFNSTNNPSKAANTPIMMTSMSSTLNSTTLAASRNNMAATVGGDKNSSAPPRSLDRVRLLVATVLEALARAGQHPDGVVDSRRGIDHLLDVTFRTAFSNPNAFVRMRALEVHRAIMGGRVVHDLINSPPTQIPWARLAPFTATVAATVCPYQAQTESSSPTSLAPADEHLSKPPLKPPAATPPLSLKSSFSLLSESMGNATNKEPLLLHQLTAPLAVAVPQQPTAHTDAPKDFVPLILSNRTPDLKGSATGGLSPCAFLLAHCTPPPTDTFTLFDKWLSTYLDLSVGGASAGDFALDASQRGYTSSSTVSGFRDTERRSVAIECLIGLLTDLPPCNGPEDHPTIGGLVGVSVELRRIEIRRVLCGCLDEAVLKFFRLGTRLFDILMRRAFYHLQRDLHGILVTVLIPLAFSSSTPYEFRCCIFAAIEAVLADPTTVVGLYINCDCSPDFGDGGMVSRPSHAEGSSTADASPPVGGFLSSLVPFLLTYIYTNFAVCQPSGTVTAEQQRLLQHQVLRCIVAFGSSLWNFVAGPMLPYDLELSQQLCTPTAIVVTSPQQVSAGDPINRAIEVPPRYTPQTIRQMLRNKQLLAALRSEVRRGGIKRLQPFAISCGMCDASGSAASVAQLLHAMPPAFVDEAKHLLVLALLKSPYNCEVLDAFAALQDIKGVPLDMAFKGFVCSLLHPENQPKDKQLPESQAWGHFQTVFGAEYSRQNQGTAFEMTSYAADALAGCLLFLHSTAHNPNASFHFDKADWIGKTRESMGVEFPSDILGEMYDRTCSEAWGSLASSTAGSSGTASKKKSSKAKFAASSPPNIQGILDEKKKLKSGDKGGFGSPGHHHARTVSNALLYEGSTQLETILARQGTSTVVLGGGMVGGSSPSAGGGSGMVVISNDSQGFKSDGVQTRLQSKIRGCVAAHLRNLETIEGGGTTLVQPPYIRPLLAEHATDIASLYLPTVLACLYIAGRTNPYPDAQQLVLRGRSVLDSLCGALDMDSGRLHEEAAEIVLAQLGRPLAIPVQPLSLSSIPFLL